MKKKNIPWLCCVLALLCLLPTMAGCNQDGQGNTPADTTTALDETATTPADTTTAEDISETTPTKQEIKETGEPVYHLLGDGTWGVYFSREKKTESVIKIPSSHEGIAVTSIDAAAFYGCTELTSITIPDSVTRIGGSAFAGCTGLTSIKIPNSVTSIDMSTFAGCTGLTNITIPDSVTSIGENAFNGCTGLTSIKILSSVTSIGGSAFDGCVKLTSVDVPAGVTDIGPWTFSDCVKLTHINFSGTKAQWEAITKGSNWNYNTGAYTVHCTDGDIPKQ